MRVILDTNFLIDLLRFRIDVSELSGKELFVLKQSFDELGKVLERGGEDGKLAKTALAFAAAKGLKILEPKDKSADSSLLAYAKEGYAVATQDRELKAKIRKDGGKVVLIRQKKYIEWGD
jgi:rRNA-processing protein FCF1